MKTQVPCKVHTDANCSCFLPTLSAKADKCRGRKYPKSKSPPPPPNLEASYHRQHNIQQAATSTRGASLSSHRESCFEPPTSSIQLKLRCPPNSKEHL